MTLPAEDELEILRLLSRYTQAVSAQDGPALLAIFAEDGVWERKAAAKTGKYTDRVRIEGHDALRQFAIDMFAVQGDTPYQYIAANPIISGAGTRAQGHSTAFIIAAGEQGYSTILVGSFEDEYVKTSDGWKFDYRGISIMA